MVEITLETQIPVIILHCAITSCARAAILKIKAERTFAAEGASRVHAGGAGGAGVLLALVQI